MGSGSWSSSDYSAATTHRASKGIKDFAYSHAVAAGKATGVHPTLDPKKPAGDKSPFAGKPIRESRDSDEHPESLPVAIMFDVTGSMGHIPQVLQKKLALLMDTLVEKSGVKHPQVLVGAIGDSYTDKYPLQVGQFESSNVFDEQLRSIILEGGGGGQNMESYGLAYRFAAYHTATDSIEKRGKKGYFFTMGDEKAWNNVTAEEVKKLFGVAEAQDETVESLLAKAKEKWEIYHLFAMGGSYDNDPDVYGYWEKLLGERFVKVDDPNLVCEVIAGIIHSQEAACDAATTVKDLGLKGKDAISVEKALTRITSAYVPDTATAAAGGLPASHPSAH